MYNEGRIVAAFVARCLRAGEATGLPFEVVIADDASGDDTPRLLAELGRDGRVRSCRLPANAGQFRATQAGLRAARGDWVLVLDGDLQDPPEHIPHLVGALANAPAAVLAVLAIKSHRDDPALFMLGQYVFHRVQHALSRVALPLGAGTYCIMRRAVASRIAAAEVRSANLAALVAVTVRGLAGTIATVPYEKAARYDGAGRVGWWGLIAEALESLAVTGALPRLGMLLTAALVLLAAVCGRYPAAQVALLAASLAAAALSAAVGWHMRQALASLGPLRAGE
jgi:glycosyltransferase involved in cell wall biosynthesis